MPKLGMQPIRRNQLIDATIASIHEHGFAETTVSRISAAAGVSSGIVHHYFNGKDDLLAATMRRLLSDLRAATVRRLADAKTPRDRVCAIIDGNFSSEQFAPQSVSAWLAFWAQVPHSPTLERLQQLNSRRTWSNLRHALRQMMVGEDAERLAASLAALIDGLWLRCALTPGGIEPKAARAIVREFFDQRISESELAA